MFLSIYKEKFKTVILLLFLALPPEARIHNLLSLAAKDSEITDKPESAGSSLLVQHQKLLLEHFGHKHTAVLPEDVIQCLLLGVILSSMLILLCLLVIISFDLLEFLPFIPFQALFLTFQSTHTLELALHLEQKVIKLKQDALRLMNVALACTACRQVLSLFEYAFGYPKLQESKE